jgi:pilus assembly protein Flp/PilA
LTSPGRPATIAAQPARSPQETPTEAVKQDRNLQFGKKEVNSQMLNLYWKLRSLTTRQEGQGMVEYALILVLVSIVVIVILLTMGNQIKNVFSNVVAALST